MTDRLTPAKRSANMAKIRSANTSPELALRRGLHALGLRFRLHVARLPGRPDLVFPSHSAVVFMHGCFWHQHRKCRYATMPRSQVAFWREKLLGNRRRDSRQAKVLLSAGWRVLVVWECALRDGDHQASVVRHAANWIRGNGRYRELPPPSMAGAEVTRGTQRTK